MSVKVTVGQQTFIKKIVLGTPVTTARETLSIDEFTDFDVATKSDGQILVYDSSEAAFKNFTLDVGQGLSKEYSPGDDKLTIAIDSDKTPVVTGILSKGNLTPTLDSTFDLGDSNRKWRELYLSGGTIHLGGLNLKDSGGDFAIKDSAGDPVNIDLAGSIQQIRGFFSSGGDLSYDSATGRFQFDVEEIYTKENFDSDLGAAINGGVGITYDSATDTISIDSAELEANFKQDIRGYISADKGLVYNSTTGNFDIDSANVRGMFSAGGDLSYNSSTGEFSFDVEQVYTKDNFESDLGEALAGGTGITYDSSSDTINITNTGVSAGAYGSATAIPILNINAQGQVTSASTASVSGISSIEFDSASGIFTINTADGQIFNSKIADSSFTASRARDVLRAIDAGGDGSFTYDSASGTFTYTGPSASEVRAHFSASNSLDYNSSTGEFRLPQPLDSAANPTFNQLRGPTNFIIDPSGIGDNTGTVQILGNLQVEGTQTIINSTTVSINDKNIVIADSAADSSALDGGGITWGGSSIEDTPTFNYSHADARLVSNREINAPLFSGSGASLTNLPASSLTGTIDSARIPTLLIADIGNINSIDHDALTNFVANEHIDHSGVSIIAGNGLTGGGDITSSRTINIDSANVRGMFSAGGDLSYNSSTGQFSIDVEDIYTSDNFDSDLDAALNGGVGINYNTADNTINIDSAELAAYFSTDNITEGNNLYYTTARFDSDFGDNTTSDLTEGSNLYYTTARFDSDFNDNTTSDLTEGSNLYYTTARADSDFDVRLATKSTTNLTEGDNLYYTKVRTDSDIDAAFAAKSTSDLSEGTNLYYTTARADSDAKNSISVTDAGGDGSLDYNSTTGVLTYTGPSAAEVRAHLNGGHGIVYSTSTGNISVDSSEVRGLFSASGDLTYNSGTGQFSIDVEQVYSKANFDSDLGDANTGQLPEGSNLYYTTARADSDFDVRLATKTTTDLSEGNNLYYTTARADSDAKNAISVTDAGGDGSLSYSTSTGVLTYTGPSASEVRAHFSGDKGLIYNSSTGVFDVDSANIRGMFSASGDLTYNSGTGQFSIDVEQVYSKANFDSDLGDANTGQLPEGSNLYYTTARADSDAKNAISVTDAGGDGSLGYNSATGVLTYTGPSAAEVRAHFTAGEGIDITSGEISGEDATTSNKGIASFNTEHFSVSSGAVSIKADGIDDTHIDFGTGTNQVNTGDIPEQTNLYYTKVRVDSDFDARLATKSTSDLSEGSNLYYTTARADSDAKAALFAVDAGGDGSFTYDSSTGVMTYTGPSASEVRAHFTGGTGVTITDGEIAIGQPVGTSDNVTFGDLNVSNLTVTGTTTEVNTIVYTVNDPLIHLADSNEQSDVVDIGFIGHYYRNGDRRHAGIFRDASNEQFYFFHNMVDSSFDSVVPPNVINRSATGYTGSTVNAGTFVGALTGNASTATTLETSRTIGMTGDVSWTSASFNGSGDVTGTSTLATVNSNVGSFGSSTQVPAITVNAKGLITGVTATNINHDALTNFVANEHIDHTSITLTAGNGLTGGGDISSSRTFAIDSANVRGMFSASGDLTYNSGTGQFSIDVEQVYSKANFDSDLGDANTGQLPEGSNLYYTTARADSDAKNAISVTDAGGDGSLSYSTSTGVLTYTGPSASEVRAHFSAGEGIDISGGTISGEDATISNKGIASFDSDIFTVSFGAVTIKANGIDDTHIDFGTGTNQVSTADIPEQTNLYYTDARVESLVDSAYVQARQSGGEITIQEEGSSLSTAATTLNFVGNSVTASGAGTTKTITITGTDSAEIIALIDSAYVQARQTGGEITIQEEGSSLSTAATTLNFVGDAVTASGTGTTKTITITGSSLTVGTINNVKADAFVGDNSNRTFTLSNAPADSDDVLIFINGILQHTNTYSISGDTVTLDSAPDSASEIEARTHLIQSSNIVLRDHKSYIYTLSTTTDSVSGPDSAGVTLAYDVGKVDVFANGARLVTGKDFTAGNGTSIVFDSAFSAGNIIEVVSHAKAAVADINGIIAIDSDLTTTTADQIIHTFNATSHRTLKFTAQIEHDSSSSYHAEEVLLTHNGTTVAMTTYAQVLLDSNLGTFDADINSGIVRLKFSPTKTNTSIKLRAIRTTA